MAGFLEIVGSQEGSVVLIISWRTLSVTADLTENQNGADANHSEKTNDLTEKLAH
jgi:hypothetical protein